MRRVLLAASPGGHLAVLDAVAPVVEPFDRLWVTLEGPRTDDLRLRGEAVAVLPAYDRHARALARNVAASVELARRYRPDVVVTSGAGPSVPVVAAARAMGAQVIFIETMARVTSPSRSGRVLSRLARRTLVQWPEIAPHYPRSVICAPILLEEVGVDDNPRAQGTLVAVGTHSSPFDRMLQVVDRALADGTLPRPALVQAGPSEFVSRHATVQGYLAPLEMERAMSASRYIVCHAGVGLITTALRLGRRPIVIARRQSGGEHFDDHQLQIVEKLGGLGLLVSATDSLTEDHLRAADAPMENASWGVYPRLADVLAEELAGLASHASRGLRRRARRTSRPSRSDGDA